MKHINKFSVAAVVLAVAAGVLSLTTHVGQAQMSKSLGGFQIAVDSNGAIHLPEIDYRKDRVVLGSWAVAAEQDGQRS